MNELGLVQAIILGAVQGLSEFLPISSSGHLAIVQRWMGLQPDSHNLLLFDVLAHLGTLLAVFVVFRTSIVSFIRRLRVEAGGHCPGRAVAWRIVWLAGIATVTTAAIALPNKDLFQAAFGEPIWIGGFLMGTGVILAGTRFVKPGRRGWREFCWWHAVLIGIAQACAILPGISRSGATICTALYGGIRRRWAGEFSFLIAVPAILGATLSMVADMGESVAADGPAVVPIAAGVIVSFITGIVALRWLMSIVRRGRLSYFAPYCFVVGLLVVLGVL